MMLRSGWKTNAINVSDQEKKMKEEDIKPKSVILLALLYGSGD